MRTARYARSWKAGAHVRTEETDVDRLGTRVPATLTLPAKSGGRLPGWIALGGISCMGRHHPQLVRFAGALASSGAAVLVPEIPEWRELRLAPLAVSPTIDGCIERLRSQPEVDDAPYGVIGFSFGAPQVAIAGSRGSLGDAVGGIVLFGGYCSLERTMTCLLTGEHDWDGQSYAIDPDPFGRWVVASNYLTHVSGCEDAHDVADALRSLAQTSSGHRIPAWDHRHDALIREHRHSLPSQRRRLFDIFARPSDEAWSVPEEAGHIAKLLAEACRLAEPLLDPATALPEVRLPTQLIHGYGDRLIPFTEGLRLHGSLPEQARRSVTVTRMFNHTADSSPTGMFDRARENLKMLGAIRGMINTV